MVVFTHLLLFGLCSSAECRRPIEPSHASAKSNAFHIFNAIHSAGRVWGSSLNHNGFGFFPVIIPRGTLLYHGSRYDYPASGLDWLAFEIEHAETFAVSRKLNDGECRRLWTGGPLDPDDCDRWNSRGYFHTYRANRDLNLLYIDGMGAAKSKMGTLDSQDLLLRENKTGSWNYYMDEAGRVRSICDIISTLGLDGFVRMEIGFEAVLCDFDTGGVDLVTITRSLLLEQRVGSTELELFQHARAIRQQFHGLQADRLRIDFSSMVSGFFFPINISGTDPNRPDLIRLAATSLDELKDIKEHLLDVLSQTKRFTVNWQAIVDMIVSRLADRLILMGSNRLSAENFVNELEKVTLTYLDAPTLAEDIILEDAKNVILEAKRNGATATTNQCVQQHPGLEVLVQSDRCPRENRTAEAIDRCTAHYLMPALPVQDRWSAEDRLIHTAISTVTHRICHTLYSVHSSLVESSVDAKASGSNEGVKQRITDIVIISQQVLRHLISELGWTEWKKVRPCPVGQVWFVSMYPYGTKEDHFNPGCRTIEDMKFPRIGYWDLDYFQKLFPDRDTSGV